MIYVVGGVPPLVTPSVIQPDNNTVVAKMIAGESITLGEVIEIYIKNPRKNDRSSPTSADLYIPKHKSTYDGERIYQGNF